MGPFYLCVCLSYKHNFYDTTVLIIFQHPITNVTPSLAYGQPESFIGVGSVK